MKEQVLTLAGEIAGSGASAALLEPLCEAAVERWKRRLSDGMEAEDCGTAFVCAAAFTAAADLLAGQSGGSVSDFTVGEISVKGRTAADSSALSQSLRQAAEKLMAPYAASADFAFRGGAGMNQAMVKEILARYGETVTVEAGDGTAAEALAFLQPVTKQSETVPENMTGIGWSDGRLWLYLGDTAVDTGHIVVWKEQRFRVRSGRAWYLGQELNHWWALLEQAKEAAE